MFVAFARAPARNGGSTGGLCLFLLSCGLLLAARVAGAGAELVAERVTPSVFGGGQRTVAAQFRNGAQGPVEEALQLRLYQASASTLAPVEEARPWKTLSLPAGQVALESLPITFPAVRSETIFHIAVFSGEKKLGALPVRVFPEELLKPLTILAGGREVGLLDPEGTLRPSFASVPTVELKQAEDILATESQLIIVAPVSPESRPPGLAAVLKRKAASGAAIVWIQPPVRRVSEPLPEAYVWSESGGNIVIAQASTVDDFSHSPRAQLNLLRLAELATGHKKLQLPADPP